MYSDLIIPDINALEKSKGKTKDKTENISNVLKSLELVFTAFFLHRDNAPKPESEESIVERTKLRRQRSDEIAKKEKAISPELFKRYFGYSGPSDMYKTLNKARTTEGNKARVNEIEIKLTGLIEMLKSNPTSDAKKVRNINNKSEVVERILYFNQLNQAGKGLKILTPNQMLSRLPITLAQLKAGNNSEKLKNEIRQLLCSLYRPRKLTKNIYKSLVDII